MAAYDNTAAHLGEDEAAQPADTIHIVAVDVPCREVREVLLDGGEWTNGVTRVEGV